MLIAYTVLQQSGMLPSRPEQPRVKCTLLEQSIDFCTSADGTRIAYAVSCHGVPLVRPATWMTHVDLDQDGPVWGPWWRELARHRQLIRYDQRGCGSRITAPATTPWKRGCRTSKR